MPPTEATATAAATAPAPDGFRGLVDGLILWLGTSGLQIVFVLVLATIAAQILKRLGRRLRSSIAGGDPASEKATRADTLVSVVQTIGGLVIFAVSSMMILREIGIDVGPLLAAAGIGGLAIGFGAQTLVKDVITGFFLLVEDQIRVGDVVEAAGKSGVVEAVTLRTLRLRDMAGTVHVIPNSSVTIVSNSTRGFSRYVFDIPLSDKADPTAAFRVLRDVDEELRRDPKLGHEILEPLEVLGIEAPTKQPVVKARITTRPRRQWRVGRELNLRIRQRFAEAGIELR